MLNYITNSLVRIRDRRKKNSFNNSEKKEIRFLKTLIKGTAHQQKNLQTLLDALETRTAEVCGVEACRLMKNGELGYLERERGALKDGTVFYFNRAYKVHGFIVTIESAFHLPPPKKPYAYQERY